jgi:adenylyltransferase/sulfurtransferase
MDEAQTTTDTTRNPLIVITDPTADRYNAYKLISWWRQDVLKDATLAVLGAGAVGNEVIKNLALMGVGQIFIADFDTIERGNLSRSVLFRQRDEGQRKAEVAALAAKDINPDVRVQWFHGDVIHELGLGFFRRMDVVICCLDSRQARLAINRACWKMNRPWLDAGLNGLYSETRIFWPGRGACYECTLSDQDYRLMEERTSCQQLAIEAFKVGRIPTTPTSASIAGAVQAEEALKILHELRVKPGKVFVFDGLNHEAGWYSYSERLDCPSHWRYEPIIELPQARAATMTVRDFVALARQATVPDALLELDFEFVTAWMCGECGKREEVMRPLHALTYEQSLCCGRERLAERVFQLTGAEPFADRTLAELGVPPLEVLKVNVGEDYAYFELTGDADFLKFE